MRRTIIRLHKARLLFKTLAALRWLAARPEDRERIEQALREEMRR
jgi:hypothetical protein